MKNRPDDKIIANLKKALGSHKEALTLADACTKSGLSLNDAKLGLNFLIAEYRGNLAATSSGELLFSFPHGFNKPWEQAEKMAELWTKLKKSSLGILKLIVRGWISIVMVAYVAIFALILLAITFSNKSDREERSSFSGGIMFHMMFRMVLDSLFWTFHPFSPYNMVQDPYFNQHQVRAPKVPFYERVNRFFFGPEQKPQDETELFRLSLQEIRAQKGRIGLLDVLRITGLNHDEAHTFMAKLMLDHEGEVLVSPEGGIYYEFAALRKSALHEQLVSAPSIWQKKEELPPFTGNTAGSNMLIAGLNGFNFLMSTVAISSSWTIDKLSYIFHAAKSGIPLDMLPPPPPDSPALLLGWIPFLFSLALFAIPLSRALGRDKAKRKVAAKNGKRGLLRAIFNFRPLGAIPEEVLEKSWKSSAQNNAPAKELVQEVVRLGGEYEASDNGAAAYRFWALEKEIEAVENARKKASAKEVFAGDVIFSSAK